MNTNTAVNICAAAKHNQLTSFVDTEADVTIETRATANYTSIIGAVLDVPASYLRKYQSIYMRKYQSR